MKRARFLPAVAAVLLSSAALAGEVIGNTYISEKDGVIEISAEGWDVKDTEGKVAFQIAALSPKQQIQGMTPSVQFYRLANPGGAVTPEFMLQQLRDAYVKQGGEAGAIEPRRIAGKQVLTLPVSMSKDGGRANGLFYMMQGEKSLYWAQFFANVKVWDDARKQFDELMEKVKY